MGNEINIESLYTRKANGDDQSEYTALYLYDKYDQELIYTTHEHEITDGPECILYYVLNETSSCFIGDMNEKRVNVDGTWFQPEELHSLTTFLDNINYDISEENFAASITEHVDFQYPIFVPIFAKYYSKYFELWWQKCNPKLSHKPILQKYCNQHSVIWSPIMIIKQTLKD